MQSSCRAFCPRLRLLVFGHRLEQYRSFSSKSYHKALPSNQSAASQGSSETFRSRVSKVKGLDERTFRRKTVTRDGKTIKMLTPVVLSARITKLAEQGQLQEAMDMVRHSPPDAQNAAVWSTLIGLVMSQKKYKEAYKLFNDMKRRGMRASIRTFGALLQGYTQIEEWSGHTVQLKNVHSIWDQLSGFAKNTEENEEVNLIPFNSLIKIYGRAGEYQKMYDVYNFLGEEGPLAPDIYTFTILLNAIAHRTKLDLEETPETIDPSDPTAVAHRNAADARLIWRDLLKTCRTPDLPAIRAVLISLAKGRSSDQALALDICQEFLGLGSPDKNAKRRPPIPIDQRTHRLISFLCNGSDLLRQALQQSLESMRYESGGTSFKLERPSRLNSSILM